MAIPPLKPCPPWPTRLLLAALVGLPTLVLACGASFEEAPPTLPYYLDRLPAKPPSEIFRETFPGNASFHQTDFKAALLALANDCRTVRPPADLRAATDKLLADARLDPNQPAALCNLLNDVRDLFAAVPPVPGPAAADYIRWRVDHAEWFHLSWDGKPVSDDLYPGYVDAEREKRRAADRLTLNQRAADSAGGPLAVHWLYLCAAYDFPKGGADPFQRVIDLAPDHPRAEAARFMLARCRLVASRSHGDGYGGELKPEEEAVARRERAEARTLFEDYLKRYPKGRFAADVPGWLGGIAFSDGDTLRALDCYLQQADIPDHPEVLKSAGFMCERCLSQLADSGNQEALRRVAAHPRLAMSLIYLLVDATQAPAGEPGSADASAADTPVRVSRWRRDLLPRLAAEVAAQKDAYADKAWQGRYLTILAQAASGVGDQEKALTLCDLARDEIQRSDDLAFIQLVALERARRLPEAVAAGRDFARRFPKSPFAPAAILRVALALQDDHQAGAAVGELARLQRALDAQAEDAQKNGADLAGFSYPPPESLLTISQSVLHRDTSGAEDAEIAQLRDALLNFAPLPELAAALAPGGSHPNVGLDGADEANLRAVLVQRWLAEEENFAQAKKYATPAQWSLVAANLEKLTAEAAFAPAAGASRANAALRLADGWAGARGRLIFAPLETDRTRAEFFSDEGAEAGLKRRENGLALGWPADRIDHALSSRDEGRHAFDWWLRAADAAPAGSTTRAHALWSALRIMPSMALASPYAFQRAGETDASGLSHKLYERLRRECPESREARQFAVFYDLAPPHDPDHNNGEPDLTAATASESLPYYEPEYRWEHYDRYSYYSADDYARDQASNDAVAAITRQSVALNVPDFTQHPQRMAQEVAGLRTRLHAIQLRRDDLCLSNFLDDLNDFLQEPAARLTPEAVTRYLGLRMECIRVERWGSLPGSDDLPPVPDATYDNLNGIVLDHIRTAYREPAMAAFKDYLDFLALAVVANANISVPIPGETEDAKDEDAPGKKVPVTYRSRDYPKLAKLAGAFLSDHPHSRKREAARLLYARGLYAASRPQVREKFAVWPESGHFASGTVIVTHRQQPFDPKAIGAALNAYDREFPDGRYAGEIRNLRGLLAWRTQDWPLALDLTFQTLADERDAVLQQDAGRRLSNIFVDGLTDETERTRCLAAIKRQTGAADKLRAFLPKSPSLLRVMQSWVLAQL